MKASTRVIINTGAQYIRSIFSVVITLYTSRVILENLGVNDFGIYSIVAGVVSMLSFIQVNLSRTTQRFLNYYLGRNDQRMVVAVFNNSLLTQLVVCFVLCGILYCCTDAIFYHVLNIVPDKIEEAKIVYWIMIISLFFNLLSTPFFATLVAHENIVYSSVVQTVDALLKLPIAISLYYISNEKLIIYSAMVSGVTIINFLCYAIYSSKKYSECRHINFNVFNWQLSKDMLSFMVWTIYGTFCVVGRSQGIAILLNRSFSTAINAAYGIGNQVVGQLSFLSVALTTAINPQIIKAEGAGNRIKVFRLAEISAKYSFLLISTVLIPVYIYMDTLLSLWLTEVPPYTAMFCRWTIIISLIDWSTQSLTTVNTAVGNVRKYNLIVSTIIILTIPAVYISLKFSSAAQAVMIVYAFFTLLTAIARLLFLYHSINFPVKQYCITFLGSTLPICGINIVGCYLLSHIFLGWWCLITGLFSFVVTLTGIFLFGLKDDELRILRGIIQKIKSC